MRRRALLASTAALATAVGSAGCLNHYGLTDATDSTTDGAGTTETTTTSSANDATEPTTTEAIPTVGDGDTVTLGEQTVTLDGIALQSSFVEQRWPMWSAHASPTGLFAVLTLRGGDIGANDLRNPPVGALADDERIDLADSVYVNVRDQKPTLVSVPMPSDRDVDTAAIVLKTTDGIKHYPLTDDHLETIRKPPELSASANVPDEIPATEELHYSLTVQNHGQTPGTIATTSTHDAIYDAWWTRRRTVAPNDSETIHFDPYDATGELEITIDWGFGDATETTTVENGTTTN